MTITTGTHIGRSDQGVYLRSPSRMRYNRKIIQDVYTYKVTVTQHFWAYQDDHVSGERSGGYFGSYTFESHDGFSGMPISLLLPVSGALAINPIHYAFNNNGSIGPNTFDLQTTECTIEMLTDDICDTLNIYNWNVAGGIVSPDSPYIIATLHEGESFSTPSYTAMATSFVPETDPGGSDYVVDFVDISGYTLFLRVCSELEFNYFSSEGGIVYPRQQVTDYIDALYYTPFTPIWAYPSEGYEFYKWTDGETDNPRVSETISSSPIPTRPKNIVAIFKDSGGEE